eukprot:TRINITY_DN1707_c0_g1_i2.p1 TRINITY_DN1707_c0_g1~~TRINITY_DN1707_c0_g1_i2.p1  ORF type:complete len:137 (+),score=15.45 TRINITY_DN1707_c0_g1_i2:52-411(+)
MSPHQVVFGEPYNSADQKNLKKHMEIMEHVRHDVKKRSIAVKVHQSIQYDKNKKESAFATRYRVNVQHLKGPFTVEELKTTFCHADPKQLVNLKGSRNDVRKEKDTDKGDGTCGDQRQL